MPFNVDDFRTNLNNYGEAVHADKFDVYFVIPPAVADSSIGTRELSLLCEVSELPGRAINMIEFKHYGFIQRLPHFNNYGVASFTFIATGIMAEKKLFDRWLDVMIPADTGLVTYPWDDSGNHVYDTDVIVNQYDMLGNQVYTVRLVDAIPLDVAAMNQSWSDDSIMRVQVTFGYKKWLSSQTISQSSAFGSSTNGFPNLGGIVNNYFNSPIKNISNQLTNRVGSDLTSLIPKL